MLKINTFTIPLLSRSNQWWAAVHQSRIYHLGTAGLLQMWTRGTVETVVGGAAVSVIRFSFRTSGSAEPAGAQYTRGPAQAGLFRACADRNQPAPTCGRQLKFIKATLVHIRDAFVSVKYSYQSPMGGLFILTRAYVGRNTSEHETTGDVVSDNGLEFDPALGKTMKKLCHHCGQWRDDRESPLEHTNDVREVMTPSERRGPVDWCCLLNGIGARALGILTSTAVHTYNFLCNYCEEIDERTPELNGSLTRGIIGSSTGQPGRGGEHSGSLEVVNWSGSAFGVRRNPAASHAVLFPDQPP